MRGKAFAQLEDRQGWGHAGDVGFLFEDLLCHVNDLIDLMANAEPLGFGGGEWAHLIWAWNF